MEDFRLSAFEELRDQIRDRGGRVRSKSAMLCNPDPALIGRPALWEPAVVLENGFGYPLVSHGGFTSEELNTGFTIASVDQFKWGHPNTGAHFPLEPIPLDYASNVADRIRRVAFERGFPLEALRLHLDKNGTLQLTTRGAHNQFDYRRVFEGDRADLKRAYQWDAPAGAAMIKLAGSDLIQLSPAEADELEFQLGEGAMAMGAILLDQAAKKSDKTIPWSDAMREIRRRVEIRSECLPLDSRPLGREASLRARFNHFWSNPQGVLERVVRQGNPGGQID